MDAIADMLTRIRNSQAVGKPAVDVPFSKIKLRIAEILAENKFIRDFKETKKGIKKNIIIFLKYDKEGKPAIISLKKISKPGRKIYLKSKEIRKVREGYGISIISTPKGLMTGQKARKENLGGEIIAEIW